MSHDPVQNPYTKTSGEDDYGDVQGPSTIRQSATINQIISLALIGGLIAITSVVSFLVISNVENKADLWAIEQEDYLFLGLGYGIFIASACASVFMRLQTKMAAAHRFQAAHRERPTTINEDTTFPGLPSLLAGYATANIIGAALLEGPAVINAIFMMIDDNLWHLIPIGCAVVGILITLPTATKIKHFVENSCRG